MNVWSLVRSLVSTLPTFAIAAMITIAGVRAQTLNAKVTLD